MGCRGAAFSVLGGFRDFAFLEDPFVHKQKRAPGDMKLQTLIPKPYLGLRVYIYIYIYICMYIFFLYIYIYPKPYKFKGGAISLREGRSRLCSKVSARNKVES